jgi:hypothetical protein
MSQKATSVIHIIALMIITLIAAFVIGTFLPRKTQAPVGPQQVEQIPEIIAPSVITFENLNENDHMKPKQIITGEVPGYWFFERSFPVELRKASGETFATVIATTAQDWMVTTNVKFEIKLPDNFTYTGVGSILFKKDDPSDGEAPWKPEYEKVLPVIFEN